MKVITDKGPQLQVITEGTKEKRMYVRGIFSTADKINANGRVYPREILEREIDKFGERVKNGTAWGCLGHPVGANTTPETVCMLVESLEWQRDSVIGKAKIVPTPSGKIVETMAQDGLLGVSSRGIGDVDPETNEVLSSYSLLAYDLVLEPSNNKALLTSVYEDKELSKCTAQKIIQEELEVRDWGGYHFLPQGRVNADVIQRQDCLCETCGQRMIQVAGRTCQDLTCPKCLLNTMVPTQSKEDVFKELQREWVERLKR